MTNTDDWEDGSAEPLGVVERIGAATRGDGAHRIRDRMGVENRVDRFFDDWVYVSRIPYVVVAG